MLRSLELGAKWHSGKSIEDDKKEGVSHQEVTMRVMMELSKNSKYKWMMFTCDQEKDNPGGESPC